MKLYRVNFSGLDSQYVVATSYDEAVEIAGKHYDDADYGYFNNRKVTSVDEVARGSEIMSESNLLIQQTEATGGLRE